jgi:hypothetical protein
VSNCAAVAAIATSKTALRVRGTLVFNADKLIGKMTTFYPFCMTSWEAILTKEVIVPSPTMSANVINKDNEGSAKKLIFPARRRLQLACIGLVVCGLRSTGPKIDRLPS